MSPRILKALKISRIASQALFFALFLFLYTRSLDPFAAAENPFLRFDPLIFLTNPQASLAVIAAVAGLLVLSIFLGRAFCGWICPLGALIESVDFLLSPLRKRNPVSLDRFEKRKVLIRYPVSLLLLGAVLITVFSPAPLLQFFHPNIWIIRIVSFTALGLAFFGLLVLFALFARRLWCAYLCPLGALYGLAARIPLFRLRIAACSACARCDRCPTDAADYTNKEILYQQCILCFDYEHSCPVGGFRFGLLPSPLARRSIQARPQRSRRRFLKDSLRLAAGLALGGLLSIPARRRVTTLLRPPGVLDEARFLENCLRCLQCVRSCPNQIIKITDQRHGFASLYTPHLEFHPYGCDYFCQVCQQVCPNRAIPLQSLQDKQSTPIGVARIDEQACVVYAKGTNCLVCEEVCPVPEKAIRYEIEDNPRNEAEPLQKPKMVAERCIGCGICEAKCPAEPLAITVYAAT